MWSCFDLVLINRIELILMQLYWEICLTDLFTHLNRIIQLTFKILFIANKVMQKTQRGWFLILLKPKIIFREKMTLIDN